MEALTGATGWPASEVLTVVFSAKETVYKCLYPEVGRYFGFHDARVEVIDPARDVFVVRLLVTLTSSLRAGLALEGAFERRADVVITGLAVE